MATLGFKYNMSDIMASLGIHQLAKLPQMTAARQRVARQYQQILESVPEITVPKAAGELNHVWHLFVMGLCTESLSIDRGRFIELMRAREIATSVHYIPIHYHSAYGELFSDLRGQFPNTEHVYEGAVSLPIYPSLAEAQVQRVGEAAVDIIRQHRR